ncbi:hypothetical protein ABZX85_13285 [Streptomyces sp. NPDC004539]|uniref:hypothetical protein n=1 Tax=Streptomyces sp. NPDC004539 TaxID=3154280 RepID=UPI0033AEEFD3
MRTSALALSVGAAAVTLLGIPATASAATTTTTPDTASVSSAFRGALDQGTVVRTQDYCEPGANIPGRCS